MTSMFRERLTPSVFVFLIAAVFGLMLGVIVIPVSLELGLGTSIVLALVLPLVLFFLSPIVEVNSEAVTAGRARIEVEYLGAPRVLGKEDLSELLGPAIRPQDFRVIRGWIPTGVEVPVVDPEDPTPAWVMTLRNPEGFAAALEAAHKARALTR